MSATQTVFADAPNLRKHFASIQEQFELFHAQHPWIYRMIVERARLVKSRGRKHYGIKTIWELLRWHVDTETAEEFKLNDHYTSRYARLIMQHEPDLAGFFNTRNLRS